MVHMCLKEEVDLVVSTPDPIQDLLPKVGDVGTVQPHVWLAVSGLLGRRFMERWVEIWCLRQFVCVSQRRRFGPTKPGLSVLPVVV